MQDHRVVDDCIDAPALACEVRGRGEEGIAIAGVAGIAEGVAARVRDRGDGCLDAVGIDVSDADRGAEPCERFREMPPEPASGPGDQKVPVGKVVLHRKGQTIDWM